MAKSALVAARRHSFKWSVGVAKLATIENLKTRVMLSVKGSYGARAARFDDILRVVEP